MQYAQPLLKLLVSLIKPFDNWITCEIMIGNKIVTLIKRAIMIDLIKN